MRFSSKRDGNYFTINHTLCTVHNIRRAGARLRCYVCADDNIYLYAYSRTPASVNIGVGMKSYINIYYILVYILRGRRGHESSGKRARERERERVREYL